jgi:peptidoglycan-N-acetylglucosamine deacetylase
LGEVQIINQVQTDKKVIAITFDDGPNPYYTPQILEIFQKVNGKATFYMIGQQMIEQPGIVEAVVEQLHEIGNHTYSHPKLTELNQDNASKELNQTDEIIKEMTGGSPVTFRPPYLDFDERVASLTEKLDYKVIGALNLDAQDWEQPGVDHILETTRKHIKNGSILIFHDGFGDRSQTIEAVRILVNELHTQGYRLVTVSELLRLEKK